MWCDDQTNVNKAPKRRKIKKKKAAELESQKANHEFAVLLRTKYFRAVRLK